jgi:outer membrane immunogenic protein
MRRFLLAAVMLGAAAGAQAADMPDFPILRGAFTDGPPAATVYWQGYYIGGQGSYGSITSKPRSGINNDLPSAFVPPAWQPSGQLNGENGGGGAFAGYNSQWDDVVVGIEANYLHGGLRASSSSPGVTVVNGITAVTSSNETVKVSDFGSLRVRGAYVIGCFLPYLFGGAGLGSQTVEGSFSAVPPLVPAWTAGKTKLVYGYSLGFGVDIMLARGFFARVEYEYLRVTSNFDSNVNSVHAGIGYKF